MQNNAFQESLALSANSLREHYLSTAKPCDGKDAKEFEHWLDDVQRLATLVKKNPEDVALAQVEPLLCNSLTCLTTHACDRVTQ